MTPQELLKAAREYLYPREKMQVARRQTRYCYVDGPMFYLGQHIVKAMQDAGHPAVIHKCYISPDEQAKLFALGRLSPGPVVTNLSAWQSPHQYWEAVQIIHPALHGSVSVDFWAALAACVEIVGEKFGVQLNYRRELGAGHIEIADWRKVRERHIARRDRNNVQEPPTKDELWARFCEVLPEQASAAIRNGIVR